MKVKVDRQTCQGIGLCLGLAPEVFEQDEGGTAFVKIDDVEGELLERVKQAEEVCPAAAIAVEQH